MLNNIEIKWLYDLLALEACRSFTAAAEKRNISQSSFSRRIKALEMALGFELFDRHINPLQLSNEGKVFHTYARNMLSDMEYQLSKIKGDNKGKHKIKIAAAHSLAVFILPELLSGYPEYSAKTFLIESINVNEAVYNLKEGKNDFIFSFYNEDLMSSLFLHHKILDCRLHLVTLKGDNDKPLFTLSDQPIPLMKYTDDSYMGRQTSRYTDQITMFSPCIISSMSELLKCMILQGAGIGWLPDYSIKQELHDKQLLILDENKYSIDICVYIYRFATRLNLASERFWQFIKTNTDQ